MRILYLSPTEPYPGTHAGFTHVHNLLKNLCAEGNEVTLVAGEPQDQPSTGTIPEADDILGLTVHHIPASGFMVRNLRVYRKITSLLKRQKFDLIHERYEMAGGAGMKASWLRRIPLVLEVNDPLLELNARSHFRPFLRFMKHRQFHHARAIICQTPMIKQAIWEESGGGAKRSRVFVIPNGADPCDFPVTRLPKEKRIGFVGSFMPWHGVEILLDAFAKVLEHEPESSLLLIGNNTGHEERLGSRMDELGITDHVTFTGPVPPGEIPGLLSSCGVLCAPFAPELDATRKEYYRKFGFWWSPLKIFEYMASGRPIVTPDIGMVPHYLGVHDENEGEDTANAAAAGLVYPPGDLDRMSEHLLTVLRDRKLADGMGALGRKRVEEHFNWRTIAHITQMAYVSVLERDGK